MRHALAPRCPVPDGGDDDGLERMDGDNGGTPNDIIENHLVSMPRYAARCWCKMDSCKEIASWGKCRPLWSLSLGKLSEFFLWYQGEPVQTCGEASHQGRPPQSTSAHM